MTAPWYGMLPSRPDQIIRAQGQHSAKRTSRSAVERLPKSAPWDLRKVLRRSPVFGLEQLRKGSSALSLEEAPNSASLSVRM
jgi:hypothetical protein